MTAAIALPPTPATLHRRIRGEIESRIMSGEWPPGYRIPFEHELMAQYGCSRMTVSKALSELARAQLIERRRRAGTFVRRPTAMSAVLEVADIRAEITASGRAYSYHLLSRRRRKTTRAEAVRLGVKGTADVLVIECWHAADGVPLVSESRLINLDAVPYAGDVDFAREVPGSWLLAHVPWTEAEHSISAVAANDALSDRLDIEPGTPCLVIERRTWRGSQTLTAVRLAYPGAAYQLTARFKGPS
jgi:GntR family transcriptional regulator, histidine utilization repressor